MGGYEKVLDRFLIEHNLPAFRAHASYVRLYVKSIDCLAKTDKIDAKIIADFAQMKGALVSNVLSKYTDLVDLMNRRDQ